MKRKPLKALIVGLGSIGRRHLANLRQLEPDAEIVVCRTHNAPEPVVGADRVVGDLNSALAYEPEVGIVATAASTHLEVSRTLVEHGIDLLIEKPLSHTLDGVDDFIELCEREGRVVSVGYNLRFLRSLLATKRAVDEGTVGRVLTVHAEVGQYLPDWRPGVDYRRTVSARRALGGGALLELSHELDYLQWIFGKVTWVNATVGKTSDLEIDVEDTAFVTLRFSSGVVGCAHLDMVQRPASRGCKVVGEAGVLIWDGIQGQARLHSGGDASVLVESEDLPDSYRSELVEFLASTRSGRTTPPIPLEDGRRTLALALAARESDGKRVTLAG